MTKKLLILNYFQKVDQLSTTRPRYRKVISSLFKWMIDADMTNCDITSYRLNLNDKMRAKIITRETIVVAGLEEIAYLLKTRSLLSLKKYFRDGDHITRNQTIATISGDVKEILSYERSILNIISRMSGIATTTNRLVQLVKYQVSSVKRLPSIAATRKTPWMQLDKKAVAVGGGLTHRLTLATTILVKDNHLIAVKNSKKLKNTKNAVRRVLKTLLTTSTDELIQIEVTTQDEAHVALEIFRDSKSTNHLALLIDNFTSRQAQKTIEALAENYDLSTIIIEASGGIDKRNIRSWAKTGVDILSLGYLTHSARTANISLDLVDNDEDK